MRQLLVQRLSLEQKLLEDIHRAHPAAATHRDMGKLVLALKSACASLARYHTAVGGYLQSGSPSRLTMFSLATRLLLQAPLILGCLLRCCSSSGEGRDKEALQNRIFPGWALCSSSPASLSQGLMGKIAFVCSYLWIRLFSPHRVYCRSMIFKCWHKHKYYS